MNQTMEKAPSGLVNPTFIDELCVKQEIAKKKFTELKKIDDDLNNNKRNQEKSQRRKSKDEYMVFNYLWRHFLRQEMGDLGFERILKAAKRYYGYGIVGSSTMVIGSLVGMLLGMIFNSLLILLSFIVSTTISCFILGLILPYVSPEMIVSDKRKRLLELYKNTQKQNE